MQSIGLSEAELRWHRRRLALEQIGDAKPLPHEALAVEERRRNRTGHEDGERKEFFVQALAHRELTA
ncbi:MAG TPA: hypothetical protein VIL09_02105 [Microvirga sp.]